MKTRPWQLRGTKTDFSKIIPPSDILIAQDDADIAQLRDDLEDRGAGHSKAFMKGGINGRIDHPTTLKSEQDGAIELILTTADGTYPVWFWVLEIKDGTGRRHAWWAFEHDSDRAMPWS